MFKGFSDSVTKSQNQSLNRIACNDASQSRGDEDRWASNNWHHRNPS